jgi:hypothetical protein
MLESIAALVAAVLVSDLGAAELLLGLLMGTGSVSLMASSIGTSLARRG